MRVNARAALRPSHLSEWATRPDHGWLLIMRPGDEVALDVAELKAAAHDRRTSLTTRERAIAAIDELCDPSAVVLGGAVERDQLVRTYRRRVARKSQIANFPDGTEQFLECLSTEVTVDPVVVAVERDNAVVYLFLAPDTSWLVGCITSN